MSLTGVEQRDTAIAVVLDVLALLALGVADMLGVSQPTVNRHVRAAQRKLFGHLLDGD